LIEFFLEPVVVNDKLQIIIGINLFNISLPQPIRNNHSVSRDLQIKFFCKFIPKTKARIYGKLKFHFVRIMEDYFNVRLHATQHGSCLESVRQILEQSL